MLSLLVGGMKFLFLKLFVIIHMYIVAHAEEKYSVIKQGVCHCSLAIYIKKYLNAKEDLWKLKYYTVLKYNLQKIL
jgi:hypothetical protein